MISRGRKGCCGSWVLGGAFEGALEAVWIDWENPEGVLGGWYDQWSGGVWEEVG